MRLIIALGLLSLLSISNAITVRTTIPKGSIFSTLYTKGYITKERPYPLPLNHYETEIQLQNSLFEKADNSNQITLQNTQTIEVFLKLDLINYNKLLDTYQFKLSFEPKIQLNKTTLAQNYLLAYKIAKVRFEAIDSEEIALSGKFDHSGNPPTDNDASNNGFRLGTGTQNIVTMYATRNIPIKIEL